MSSPVARVVVGLPIESHFDYLVPEAWRASACPGARVLVSFAGKKRVGVIVGLSEKSEFPRLKPLLAVLDEEGTFPLDSLRLAEVFALRFGCSMGEALELFLPKYRRRPTKRVLPVAGPAAGGPPVKAVRESMELFFDHGRRQFWPELIARIRRTLQAGHSVLVLVPDAGYMDDILARFQEGALAPVALPGGTEKDEALRWDALCSGGGCLAVGFISAVLVPVPGLGLIVIMDEESQSYKHDQSPFYHAREAAFLRARLEHCAVVLVSSAPSVEAWQEAATARGRRVEFRAGIAPARLVDLGNFKMRKGTVLSLPLRIQLEKVMKAGRQSLLYIQAARGAAPVLDELRAAFPSARLAGYERDATAWPRAADIVVATQAVFRFRHSLQVDFSCVLDIDREFHRSDHRAAHAAFALTRYLRSMTRELVLLQTRTLDNEMLHLTAGDDVEAFYAREIAQRRELGFPPFHHFVALVARSADPQLACDEAKRLYDTLKADSPEGIVLHEPQPDRSAVLRGKFRWCVMAQGASLKTLMGHIKTVLKTFRGKRDTVFTVNVDP